MKPILKWAGGKRQLMTFLTTFINNDSLGKGRYYEPFFGGGSLLFSSGFKNAHLNDLNKEIINVYEVVKSNPYELIELLKIHKKNHSKDYFYKMRSVDRLEDFNDEEKFSNVYKASRTIYLNRTCFNGLYRVNSKGQFNVPFGSYANPLICDEENILSISKYLNNSKIKITNLDFEKSVETAKNGDFIYFDPPYDYEDGQGFVQYVKEGFSREDLIRLKKVCDKLIRRGCKVLISNNDTNFVRKVFDEENFEIIYETKKIKTNRSISCKSNRKNKGDEVLIYGRKL